MVTIMVTIMVTMMVTMVVAMMVMAREPSTSSRLKPLLSLQV